MFAIIVAILVAPLAYIIVSALTLGGVAVFTPGVAIFGAIFLLLWLVLRFIKKRK